MVAVLDVAGSHGESLQGDDTAALEDTIDDGRGEIVVVAGSSPVLEWLVGGEQYPCQEGSIRSGAGETRRTDV